MVSRVQPALVTKKPKRNPLLVAAPVGGHLPLWLPWLEARSSVQGKKSYALTSLFTLRGHSYSNKMFIHVKQKQ